MQTPNALTTLWEAVFGSGGQDGLSQRVAAVEAETESNGSRLDRINSKMDKLMFLILIHRRFDGGGAGLPHRAGCHVATGDGLPYVHEEA